MISGTGCGLVYGDAAMNTAFSSPDMPVWQRLESLRPCLPRHIHLQRRDYNGERWYVLQDKSNGRFHRLSPTAYCLINAMDGRRNLAQVLAIANQVGIYDSPEDRPTQEDVIHLLQYLYVADLLVCDFPPSTQELFARREQKKQQRWQRLLMNPLTWHIPLGNPDALLDKLLPLGKVLASRSMGVVWLLVVGYALLQAGTHWSQLTQGQFQRLLSPSNLFLLWLTYPFFKVLHELGHGLFTKVWGGQVTDCGVVFVVGTPLPYVDASAATGFYAKRQRLMVGAAGMAVELFLAAIALLLWIKMPPGFASDFLYNIVIIGSVSTLFFNGNPLMRFDGYHLLTDAFDLPNLATRANQQVSYWVRRYGYGLRNLVSPAQSAKEALFLTAYSLAAFAYRLVILGFIILLVAHYSPTAGLVIGGWLIFFQLVWPALKAAHFLLRAKPLMQVRKRALLVTSGTLAGVLAFLLWVPMPESTSVEAVVWLPDEARVKVESSGQVSEVLVANGDRVEEGQVLVRLHNPALVAELAVQRARVREYEARYRRAWADDRAEAQLIARDLDAIKAEYELLKTRVNHLQVRSPGAGVVRLLHQHHLPGSFFRQGDELAILERPNSVRVRAALLQTEIGRVRQATSTVAVRLASAPAEVVEADMIQHTPIATLELPSPVLGTQGGGRIAVDSRHASGTRVTEQVFLLDMLLRDMQRVGYYGERTYVKFSHPPRPLLAQWYSALQQIFIRYFS